MEKFESCTRRLLPGNYPQISFDADGECNYCRSNVNSAARHFDNGEEELVRRIKLNQKKYNLSDKYDCLISLSGGRDSTYVVYYVRRILGLNPLCFVNDNGMQPPETKQNIRNVQRHLDVDIVYGHHDMKNYAGHMIRSWLKKPSASMIGSFCVGCMSGINRGLSKVAAKTGVGLIINGGGGELPQIGSTFPLQLISSSMEATKTGLIRGFSRELMGNPRYLLNPGLLSEIGQEFYYRFIWNPFTRKDMIVMSLYSFVEWNEETITNTIKKELDWVRPSHCTSDWRTDCRLHHFKEYLYKEMLGFTKNDVLLSCMIRRDNIDRDSALERSRQDNAIPEKFIGEFCQEIGVDYSQLQQDLRR